jgi:ribosomal protein S12 methylthiotransferase accessory factor
VVKPDYISTLLLPQSANNRHGITFAPQTASLSQSDVPDLYHVGVPMYKGEGWQSASGGVARTELTAKLASIGEGVERYAAAQAKVPEKLKQDVPPAQLLDAEQFVLFTKKQRAHPDFPFQRLYDSHCKYTEVFTLADNTPYWVPQPLVVLRDDYATGIPTSSGLAAGATAADALLRGLEEVIERDALMTTWLHSLAGRRIKTPPRYASQINDLCGEVYVFDITPAYSPFPVIAVAGNIAKRGQQRYSLGVACRESLDDAIDKAYVEWCQGIFFTGIYPEFADTSNLRTADDVNNFDDHAIFYTKFPEYWDMLPLFKDKHIIHQPRTYGIKQRGRAALEYAIAHLSKQGVRMLYRDLTTIDAIQAGVHVVRVLSPDMIPINAHHRWPFIGGNASDLKRRYPDMQTSGAFPNPWPHPLG